MSHFHDMYISPSWYHKFVQLRQQCYISHPSLLRPCTGLATPTANFSSSASCFCPPTTSFGWLTESKDYHQEENSWTSNDTWHTWNVRFRVKSHDQKASIPSWQRMAIQTIHLDISSMRQTWLAVTNVVSFWWHTLNIGSRCGVKDTMAGRLKET